MTRVMSNRGWLAATAAAILCLVAAFGLASTALAAPSVTSLTIGSGTVAPGGSITIHLTTTADSLGSWGVNVQFDNTLVTPTSCTSTSGSCNIAYPNALHTVRINGSSTAGVTGSNQELGSIVFLAGSTTGTAALTITSADLTDNTLAANTLTVTPTNGSIVIVAPTAVPTAEPTAVPTAVPATASPTPKAVPNTGGPLGDSSSMSLGWLLGAAGLIVVAGGAWTLARARREES